MAKKNSSRSYPGDLLKRAKALKALIFDVDGVLTDGRIIYSSTGEELKEFHVRDGLIISHLKRCGFIVGIISGRESQAVARRSVELKLDFCHQGIDDKGWAINQIIKHHGLKSNQVAYIGDDINDIPAFKAAGLKICPSDAPEYLKELMDWTTTAKGGKGVVREVADMILFAKGELDALLKTGNKK
jgi:3-deoxy-D-manno-octulosonate 8-phosphate phosphatase (KDO 8-P phosphatase)